ncbi:MAG TPA: hypothetical protein VGE07_13920 [Herpetosiphonaceae bacterium]
MDIHDFAETVQRVVSPWLNPHGYLMYSASLTEYMPTFRRQSEEWFCFFNFQYNEETECLPYRKFFINVLRLHVDQTYGMRMYRPQGGYDPGAISIRLPAFRRFYPSHPLIAAMDEDTYLGTGWQYASLTELEQVLQHLHPFFMIDLGVLDDMTLSMGY